jgi:dCTP deaminase
MKEATPLGLFSEDRRSAARRTGILPSQEIRELIRNGKIRSPVDISDDQIQPASIDLRLGNVAHRIQASFLPGRSSPVSNRIRDLKLAELDLTKPALLERGAVFIVPVVESLALPRDIGGKANPKSTTGRLDIFTRLITDGGWEFERVPLGYSGDLYIEIVSRTFPIVLSAGVKLNQLRFVRGNPPSTDGILEQLARKEHLVYYENGDGPERASVERGGRPTSPDDDGSTRAVIDRGLRTTIDLAGHAGAGVTAYKAKRNAPPLDLRKVGAYNVADFWEPLSSLNSDQLVLNPGDFYLLASRERFRIPPSYAAEMEQYDPSMGEFSIHYAGFFDPGFGYGTEGEIKGTKAVLEVRAHEVPILLEDEQTVGRLVYHKMADVPDKLYGQGIGSSYQQQGLALSKQFKTTSTPQAVAKQA